MTPEEAVADALRRLAPEGVPLGVAVSGGSDSMALLHLAARWAAPRGGTVVAATVDHGLREGSMEEAVAVGRACDGLGVAHETLIWIDREGRGNLQEAAREARRRLLGAWARRRGAAAVLLGHTMDDQAETVLLRLARGSGVDGLAGMAERTEATTASGGTTWVRPLLGVTREALRGWLLAQGVPWAEDPSNDDLRFDRARARAMMGGLADLGLTRERLVRTAGHMARARAALDQLAAEALAQEWREEGGDLILPLALVGRVGADEAAGRALALALMRVGGHDRRPRWEALLRLAALVAGGRAATLHGCRVAPEGAWARVARERRA